MARIRKSDGTTVEVPDEDVWGPPKTAAQLSAERRALLPPVTRTSFAIALAASEVITTQEAKDFAGGNSLPEIAATAIDGGDMEPLEQMKAEIKALSATTVQRMDQIVLLIQKGEKLTAKQVDTIFETAAQID